MTPRIRRERRAAAATPPLLFLICVLTLVAPHGAAAQIQISICHATGNPSQPFEPLVVTPVELQDHLDHEGDLIPAPAAGCPAVDEPDPTPSAEPDSTAYALPTISATIAPTAVPTAAATPTATATPRARAKRRRTKKPGVGVLPANAGSGPGEGAGAPGGSGLPLTGGAPGLVGLAGFGLLLAGLGLSVRLRSARG